MNAKIFFFLFRFAEIAFRTHQAAETKFCSRQKRRNEKNLFIHDVDFLYGGKERNGRSIVVVVQIVYI